MYSFANLKSSYEEILKTVRIHKSEEIDNIVTNIRANEARYRFVEDKTNVPWYLIAAIHNKEASCRFDRNLCNGQKLSMKTTIVPIGRGPYKNWEESAIDALGLQKSIQDEINESNAHWSMVECLYYAERYNGTGYRSKLIDGKPLSSPYLWAQSTAYVRGGFPKDHFFDPNFVVKNPGVYAIISTLIKDHPDYQVKMTFEEKAELFYEDHE